MGAREDFMAIRRAASALALNAGEPSEAGRCVQRLLAKASAGEVRFVRLRKGGVQDEIIDLAYAVLREDRPGGPAVPVTAEAMEVQA